ncbi:MAG: hypothetical protein WCI89_03845 [bacterium]
MTKATSSAQGKAVDDNPFSEPANRAPSFLKTNRPPQSSAAEADRQVLLRMTPEEREALLARGAAEAAAEPPRPILSTQGQGTPEQAAAPPPVANQVEPPPWWSRNFSRATVKRVGWSLGIVLVGALAFFGAYYFSQQMFPWQHESADAVQVRAVSVPVQASEDECFKGPLEDAQTCLIRLLRSRVVALEHNASVAATEAVALRALNTRVDGLVAEITLLKQPKPTPVVVVPQKTAADLKAEANALRAKLGLPPLP